MRLLLLFVPLIPFACAPSPAPAPVSLPGPSPSAVDPVQPCAPTPAPIIIPRLPRVPHSYADAVAVAREISAPMLLIFSAEWCEPCRRLHRGPLHDPKVLRILEAFVVWHADADRERTLCARYHVQALPTLIIADSAEHVLHQRTGYCEAAELHAWLRDHAPRDQFSFYPAPRGDEPTRFSPAGDYEMRWASIVQRVRFQAGQYTAIEPNYGGGPYSIAYDGDQATITFQEGPGRYGMTLDKDGRGVGMRLEENPWPLNSTVDVSLRKLPTDN